MKFVRRLFLLIFIICSIFLVAPLTSSYGPAYLDPFITMLYEDSITIFGGPKGDDGNSVLEATDGGYIIVGSTYYPRGSGSWDVQLIKTDSDGNGLWYRTFGGANIEHGYSVQQTTDGGYIIAGDTESFGAGGRDIFLIKTDSDGRKLWHKTFGGPEWERGLSVQQTTDGDYIVAGVTTSFGAGRADVYLVKIDSDGDELWSKTFGGVDSDVGYSVQQTTDGGYIIAGITWSFGAGGADIYLIKTDSDGNELWSKTIGSPDSDEGFSVQQTTDGGYIIAGDTNSSGAGKHDFCLIKTDTKGNILWGKTYGGPDYDFCNSMQQTFDEGYIMVGTTKSFGAGDRDILLIKTDIDGNMLWDKIFGGPDYDTGESVQQTTDGDYIITGRTDSFSHNPPFSDVYLIQALSGNTKKSRTSQYKVEKIEKTSSSLTCLVSSEKIVVGGEITVSGFIQPALAEKTVTLQFSIPDVSIKNETVRTAIDGSYIYTFIPEEFGDWRVRASWLGDAAHEGAVSSIVSFTVTKASTTISIRLSKSEVIKGQSITISGSIKPEVSGAKVTITFTRPDASTFTKAVSTGTDGSYSDSYTPTETGSWSVKASWEGKATHAGSTSQTLEFFVIEPTPTGSLKIIVQDESDNPINGATVSSTSQPVDQQTLSGSSGTDGSVTFADVIIGDYTIEASKSGCETSSKSITVIEGETITLTIQLKEKVGTLKIFVEDKAGKPVNGATITSTSQPSGQSSISDTTDSGGSVTFRDVKPGSYTLQASKSGYITKSGSGSAKAGETTEITIILEKEAKKGCIIATATYGSELSPEVQFLRGFRDDIVLNTFAGKNFMTAFNRWYYSFSQTVASIIAVNNLLRGFMKIILYPLIGILHLAATTYSLFSFKSEFAVVVSGLVASSLIGVTYFVPVVLILYLFKKVKISIKALQAQSLIWILNIGCITIAEIIQWPDLMMFSTSIFMLNTISLTILYSMRYITRLTARVLRGF